MPNLKNVTFSSYNNSFSVCNYINYTYTNNTNTIINTKNDVNGINCDDSYECKSSKFALTTSNGPICCTGSESCFQAVGMTSNNNNNNNNNNNVAIRCDSYLGCYYTGDIVGNNGGDVYFTGLGAGRGSDKIETKNNNDDIICSGRQSCSEREFLNASNVYCLGYYSCTDLDSIEYIGNIYAYGYYALEGSEGISNIFGNIYCATYKACTETIIDGVFGNIYGTSYQVFRDSRISNVLGYLTVFAYQGLYEAKIDKCQTS